MYTSVKAFNMTVANISQEMLCIDNWFQTKDLKLEYQGNRDIRILI